MFYFFIFFIFSVSILFVCLLFACFWVFFPNIMLRLLTGCFILVGSAMFGATFNLVTRVGLQSFLEHRRKIFVMFVAKDGVNSSSKNTKVFEQKLKLYILDHTIWFKFHHHVVQIRSNNVRKEFRKSVSAFCNSSKEDMADLLQKLTFRSSILCYHYLRCHWNS